MSDAGAEKLSRAERIALRVSVIQTVIAVTGFFIGVIALYAALNEADAVRKQLQASVWPHLRVTDINHGVPGEEKFDIIVSNRGIGPAVVKSVAVTVDGEEKVDWFEVVQTVAGKERFGLSNINIGGAVIAPTEDIVMVSLDSKFATSEITRAFRDLTRSGRANLRICYCSVFDDCWTHDALSGETIETKSCPAHNPASNI
ncbi:MAG: hypothetical protein KDD85_00525 [Parvularculaceae bacterium]|nr:hypothetical protein [Parvularculaceae bacterium]